MQSFIKFCYGGWVRYALLILCSVYLPNIQAQTLDSRFGSAHTPKGHLHLLVVFVRYDSDPTGTPAWSNSWPDSAILPVFARDSGPNTPNIPGMNQLFTADTTTLKSNLGYQNISQYYYRMSDGKFLLTGDVYEQQVRPSRHHRAPRGQACRTAFGGTGTTLPNKKRMRTQSLRSTGSLFLCLSAT